MEQAKNDNLQNQAKLKVAAETEASLKKAEELNEAYEQKIEDLKFKAWMLEEEKNKRMRKQDS